VPSNILWIKLTNILGFEAISNDELREKTSIFKSKIQDSRIAIDTEIRDLNTQIKEITDIDQREDIYNRVDILEADGLKLLKTV